MTNDLLSHGAVLDGVTDDGPAVQSWLAACIESGGTGFSSRAGTALCSTFATLDTTDEIRIEAPGLTLLGPETPVNLFSCGGNVDVRRLGLERWKACFERSRTKAGFIDWFRLRECTISNVANVVAIERPIRGVRITENQISRTSGGYAIRIGRNVAGEQDDWRDIRICGNDFADIEGVASTAAVLVYGRKVSIRGNTVEGVRNIASSEAWGFYLKCRQAEISGNTIIDVQTATHRDVVGINMKGAGMDSAAGVQGYGVRCIGNHIERIGISGERGGCIRVQTDNVIVQGNHCEGGGLDGIAVDENAGSQNVLVNGNNIRGSSTGVRVSTGGKGHSVTNNNISNCTTGVRLSASAGADGSDYTVADNRIEVSGTGIAINTPRSMTRIGIHANAVAGGAWGFRNDSAPSLLNGLRLIENDFGGCAAPLGGVMPAGCEVT